MGLLKGGEGLTHLQVEDHGPGLGAEAMEKCEDQGVVADRIAEVGEGHGHRLEVAAEVGDRA